MHALTRTHGVGPMRRLGPRGGITTFPPGLSESPPELRHQEITVAHTTDGDQVCVVERPRREKLLLGDRPDGRCDLIDPIDVSFGTKDEVEKFRWIEATVA